MRRAVLAAVAALALVPSANAATPAPPRLSADTSHPDIASTYGSGAFGSWGVDDLGLPRYRYTLDEAVEKRAKQPETPYRAEPSDGWHQVGNDHIVANAFNHGYTQLWSQDRLSQWANRYDPGNRHYSGGYGYLNVGGKVLSTLYSDRPKGAGFERDFGVGYYRKRLVAEGMAVTEDTFAPFGDDPLLVDQVRIENRGSSTRKVSWFEYWDVDPYNQGTGFQKNIGLGLPAFDQGSRTLSVGQLPGSDGDNDPLSIFAAALGGPLDGFDTSVNSFFGSGTRAAPAAVAADKLSGSIATPSPAGASSDQLFAFRAPVTLAPGQSITLRYAYGMAHPAQIAKLVAKYRGARDPLGDSGRSWSRWLPKADFGAGRRWVARELAWDAYLLRSASVYEEVCGAHTITQGGYYQYDTGDNLGYRSWLHYLLPIAYSSPELAREILRYSIKWQPPGDPRDQQEPYGAGQLCTRFDLGTSNDLDFWLLLAAAEYGLGTRDVKFFDEQLPYYGGGGQASAWQHLKEAFAHQETLRGPHGGYVMGSTGDWNDFSTQLEQMSESMLVTAQLAYAYPQLAELADLRGDRQFAAQLRKAGAEDLATVRREWVGRGWYSRGYSGDRQVGTGVIFEEPQPWAILAGAPSLARTKTLVANIRRYLDGIGAPAVVHGPAQYATAQSPSRHDPDVTEIGPVGRGASFMPEPLRAALPDSSLTGAAQWPGGVWFDLNGHLTWAYASLDGKLPGARGLAWDEYTRNTLARHAALWPNHWAGTISVDDVCHAWYGDHAESCGTGLSQTYDGQITEQPTWMVMDAIRLAGVTPTQGGFEIFPHLPFGRFSLRLPVVGVAGQPGELRGYVRPEASGTLQMKVHVPDGADRRYLRAFANGRVVARRIDGDFVRFRLPATAGRPADWALSGSCLARRSPIGPRNIGRVRLRFTRGRLRRRVPLAVKTTRRRWRWCVKRSKGSVTAAFTRKGRVALVATTARSHGNRGVRPGVKASRLRRAYRRRRSVGRGLFRASPRSPRLIGVRRGRVRYVAIASPGLIRNRKALRRYLRLAGVERARR